MDIQQSFFTSNSGVKTLFSCKFIGVSWNYFSTYDYFHRKSAEFHRHCHEVVSLLTICFYGNSFGRVVSFTNNYRKPKLCFYGNSAVSGVVSLLTAIE